MMSEQAIEILLVNFELMSKGHFMLGPISRAHFQTLGINQRECLDCPNMGPTALY
jgi:hypothetical protein